jgi:hypothetical protein
LPAYSSGKVNQGGGDTLMVVLRTSDGEAAQIDL